MFYPDALAVDCGAPPPLENGQILDLTNTSFQSMVLYKCIDGYNLEGEASRTCTADRTWSGIQPVCRGKYMTCVSIKNNNELINIIYF